MAEIELSQVITQTPLCPDMDKRSLYLQSGTTPAFPLLPPQAAIFQAKGNRILALALRTAITLDERLG